tara:strand:+ start:9906 stop:10472 length:567 start_codon:yes stop_codon:yes gene_type:complete
MIKSFKNYFLKGLLYLVPTVVTLWVVQEAYFFFNDIIGSFLPMKIPFLGIIMLIIIVTIFGYFGSIIIASPFTSIFQNMLNKAPLLKTIYTSVKDLMTTFVGKKKGFSEPVLVKVYENSTIERIGFITNEDVQSLSITEGKVLIYMPHSYAISGQLFVVDKKNVKRIDKASSEVMKLIIAGGLTEIEE